MALIERLMGNPFEPDQDRKVSVHEFCSAMYEVAFGPRTLAQIKTYYAMDAADSAEADALAALVTGGDLAKFRRIEEFHHVFILAEHRVTFYTTPAEVRARLGI